MTEDIEATADDLSARLGYRFQDPGLLAMALSHRSWCSEAGGQPSNERLEFLGDAVLGLVVAADSYKRFPQMPEGELAKVRAAVVNTTALAEIAGELDLGPFLRLGKGELASGGTKKPSILADAVEAIIGAVYLDGGWEPASEMVLELLGDRTGLAAAGPGSQDFKTRFQERIVGLVGEPPRYVVDGSGPDHDRRYAACLHVGEVMLGQGEGRSKKDAEQMAAKAAWQAIDDDPSVLDPPG